MVNFHSHIACVDVFHADWSEEIPISNKHVFTYTKS